METSDGSGCYYNILGVNFGSSDEEIRRAYKKLAMKWHPDKWTRTPMLLSESKRKFQQIQEAYSVLSDRKKRAMYDAGLYDHNDDEEDEVEGFADFVQEMVSLVKDVKKEGKIYSMENLQSMFWEMAQGFDFTQNPMGDFTQWLHNPLDFNDSAASASTSRRASTDSNSTARNSDLRFSTNRQCGGMKRDY